MSKGLLGLAALLALTGCGAAARVTPLRDQSASQIEADSEAKREAESGSGMVRKVIRDYVGWSTR